eukprot:TRINITY_DN6909_c0_g2_i2.p1 TRINITY_DN6909_c0_g2~~TRINITY_DN6909_c0_g2_i2.p1  ORF type:complete len:406 (-),score=61.74 TRINITY_DN6909_c0_g2_i2:85-1302(-)
METSEIYKLERSLSLPNGLRDEHKKPPCLQMDTAQHDYNNLHSPIPTIPILSPLTPVDSNPLNRFRRQLAPRLTPWKLQDYHHSVIGLHHEIIDFYNYMKPTPAEKRMRSELVTRIRSMLQARIPEAHLEVFGSCSTQTYLPTSDIDLVIFGECNGDPLKIVEEELRAAGLANKEIKFLDKATVPVVRFTELTTGVRIDISYDMRSGPEAASLVKKFIKTYSALPKLLVVIKQFLLQRDFNEVFSGGLSSYALTLLIVNFLQLHPRRMATDEDANLGVLLIEFFELYGRLFNYKNTGIRVTDGGSYFLKKHHQSYYDEHSLLLFIEDPLETKKVVTRGAFHFPIIRHAFEHAFLLLCSAVLGNGIPNGYQSILGLIIFLEQDCIEQRDQWVKTWGDPGTGAEDEL